MNDEIRKKDKPRHIRGTGQKISWFFSIFCYFMAIVSVVFAYYWNFNNGTQSPIFASALACIFFFITSGYVLQTIANANLPDLSPTKKTNK